MVTPTYDRPTTDRVAADAGAGAVLGSLMSGKLPASMVDSKLPVRYQQRSLVQQTRADLDWVDDKDLLLLTEKSPLAAGALSLFTGGGGQLFVNDYRKGFGFLGAAVGAFALATAVASPLAVLPLLGLCGTSSVLAWRQARAVNRYLASKRHEFEQQSSHPPALRLLAAMQASGPGQGQQRAAPPAADSEPPAPSVHQPLLDKLRKVATIHAANALSDSEFRARKIDILNDAASGIPRDDLDELLFALLPLMDEGILTDEDIEFIKELGES